MDAHPHSPDRLKRVLTAPLVTLYGLGVTVGAGIYVLVGATAAQAGAFAPISFLIAAVVVSFTALSYAELSTRYPVSAGEAAYIEAGFGAAWLATVAGLAVAASGMVSAAAVSIGAASYIHTLTMLSPDILVVAVVAVMGLIAIWGITQSVVVIGIITIAEIAGLIGVIAWGLYVAEPLGVEPSQMVPPATGPHWIPIGTAALLAFFAFVGFEDMANVAEEVKDPLSTMPKAILWTLVLATLLYFGTTATVLLVVPLDKLSASSAPLALVFEQAPQSVRQAFSVIAIVATVNGVLVQIIMASRVLFGLADRGHLPAILAKISHRTKTPIVATITVTITIFVLALSFPIDALAERTSQIVLIVFVLVNAALIRLKLRGGATGSYFKVPILVPILGVITSALLFAAGFL